MPSAKKTIKSTAFTKQELIDVLRSAKSSKEQNRAVKLLKQFDPIPHYEFDDEGFKSVMKPKKYDYLLGYVCDRCGKVKQTNYQVIWKTSMGVRKICYPCSLGTKPTLNLKLLALFSPQPSYAI